MYKYDKWSDKTLPAYVEGETLADYNLRIADGTTQPPQLLNEGFFFHRTVVSVITHYSEDNCFQFFRVRGMRLLPFNLADLIALMEKFGIGTDATHADHIEKIKVFR